MVVVHVKTRRISGKDINEENIYEEIVQKLDDSIGLKTPFKTFCKFYFSHRYKSAEVVALYVKEKSEEGKMITDPQKLAPYIKELRDATEVISPVSTSDIKKQLDFEKESRKKLEREVAEMREQFKRLQGGNEDENEDDSEKEILNARYKELTGKGAGRMSIETLKEKINEIEGI